jgi:hypothetical protein
MSSIARKTFARYTSGSFEVKRMTHAQFLNFVDFIIRQRNVDDDEDIRGAVDVYGNYKKIKNKKYNTNRELIDIITYMIVFILMFGAFVYLLVAITYFFVYRKDVVKKTIGFTLMGIIISALAMLFILWWLLTRIVGQLKNIIYLL